MTKKISKLDLLSLGAKRVVEICQVNGLPVPTIKYRDGLDFGACGMYSYSNRTIYVSPKDCAAPGYGGPAWSWPGYIIDRTPFGVFCHELGHHIDNCFSKRGSVYSTRLRKDSGEEQLTSYCPDNAEWFAEMFRLFATNPDLLKVIRPRTYALICEKVKPVETRRWKTVLKGSPDRTLKMAERKVLEASPPAWVCKKRAAARSAKTFIKDGWLARYKDGVLQYQATDGVWYPATAW